ETCPHNLYLTHDHLEKYGSWVTFSPPVRNADTASSLWNQLKKDYIFTVGSDHGPVEKKLKEMGTSNIWKGQYGIPGAETLVPLMLNAVSEGRLSLEQITGLLSENPARLYGLYPQKGIIQIGSDADFTVVDMNSTYSLNAENMQTSCGWIPYEGWEITGKVVYTILRGSPIMKFGEITGEPGYGKFIRRRNNFAL
ncbi:MAG: amidohydrolase family protein, partial [Chloroflexota bacterium]|nr:amidohydrolase family protein [Chloroflexota bacterium]